ncbi:MAG: hypothetical protein JNL82_05235 [Myxococcales bacterium]|nr:hypothetical protein [Myxococcales bacterium]
MLGFASALADDKVPNELAVSLAPTVGWLLLVCAVFVYLLFLMQSERWRRFWLTMGDPRPVALFRIVFAFLVICNINDLWEYFDFLFTDEGLFLTDAARQQFAAGQFKGYGDGWTEEPLGFFDAAGVLDFLKGPKYSLLYFWDTPSAMWVQLIVFYAVTTALLVGWKTRVMAVLSMLMMNSFFVRNHLFWEGTELVYRVFFFYLICARSGHAYSVDNWLRCRRLRAEDRLSERHGAGGGAGVAPSSVHPRGLEAVYRLIPTWPHMMIILNLAVVYCYSGTVKNGGVWAKGDALYYAIGLDHFHRFYPQELSSVVGLTAMRLMTWVTHWWEACFPLLVLGMVTRWGIRERLEPLHGWRLWATRLCWLGLAVTAMSLTLVTAPVHAPPGQVHSLQWALWIGWPCLIVGLGGLWWALGRGIIKPKIRGRQYVLDREWFCKWFLGRRVWLTLGLMFHGNLQLFMNIGMFPPIMMSIYLGYFIGDEPGRVLRLFARPLVRLLPGLTRFEVFASVARREPPLPAEDRTLPHHHRDGRKVPTALLYMLFATALVGVFLQATPVLPWLREQVLGREPGAPLHFAWTVVAIFTVLIVHTYIQGHRGTRRFTAKLLGFAALLSGYLAIMGTKVTHPEWIDAWLYFKVGLHVVIVAVLGLQQIPSWHRRFARVGLTFNAPDRPKLEPDEPIIDPYSQLPRAPWAYGPGGRMLIGFIVVYHVTAVAYWELPDKDCLSTFRAKGREAFAKWLSVTQTDQQWGMFAPNPPRHNVFMKIILVDENGESWDLRNDLYAPERKPIPWIWNDRMRKMNRRVIGGESGKGDVYQKWYGRYLCREWARTHRGVMPEKVELWKVSYKIPAPETVARQGWYWPEVLLFDTGREEKQHTEKCLTGEQAQLPDEIRERHGIAPLGDVKFKPIARSKLPTWEKRHATAAKAASKAEAKAMNVKGADKATRKMGARRAETKSAADAKADE